jgi:hypothetical protein
VARGFFLSRLGFTLAADGISLPNNFYIVIKAFPREFLSKINFSHAKPM